MRIHEKIQVCREEINTTNDSITEIIARMDRKTGCPDADGECSSMVNWNDIRSELLQARNRLAATYEDTANANAQ